MCAVPTEARGATGQAGDRVSAAPRAWYGTAMTPRDKLTRAVETLKVPWRAWRIHRYAFLGGRPTWREAFSAAWQSRGPIYINLRHWAQVRLTYQDLLSRPAIPASRKHG